jgi:uncharacterized protein YbjT (DUF2867 family)
MAQLETDLPGHPVISQPMAADDVARAVERIAVGAPVNGVVEVAGPEQFRLDQLIREGLALSRIRVKSLPTRVRDTSAQSSASARSYRPTAHGWARHAFRSG